MVLLNLACEEEKEKLKMTKKWKIVSASVFSTAELGLLIAVLTCSGKVVPPLQFSAIALAFAFSLIFVSFKDRKFIIQLALLFTVVADVFLVLVEPRNQALAMTSFSLTQILYFVKLLMTTENKKIRLANLISRITTIVLVLVVTLIVLGGKADYVALISMFYFANLVLNVIFAFIGFKQNPLFAIGLLLFMLCDIFIGLQCAIGVYIDVDPSSIIYQIAFSPFNWAWLFYIPSQTLLSLTTMRK